jgi:hypothetical protein
MIKVHELEMAVTALPQDEYAEFRQWFLESDAEKWDREIEEDVKAGKLDFLVREAAEAKKQGTLGEL